MTLTLLLEDSALSPTKGREVPSSRIDSEVKEIACRANVWVSLPHQPLIPSPPHTPVQPVVNTVRGDIGREF